MMENQRVTLGERAYNNEEESSEYEEKPSRLKSAILIAIASFLSAGLGYSLVALVTGSDSYSAMLIATIVSSILYLSFVVLESMLLHDSFSPFAGAVLQALVLSANVFVFEKSMPLMVVVGLFVITTILFSLAVYSGRAELDNAIKIRFSAISGLVTRKAFMALAVFAALSYGFSGNTSKIITDDVSGIASNAASLAVGYYVPGFKGDMTIDDLLSSLALQSVNKTSGGSTAVRGLPEGARQKLVVEASSVVKKSLETSFGIKLDPKKTFSETVQRFVSGKMGELISKIPNYYLSVALSAIIFFSLISVGFLVYWLIALVAFFIYQIFLVTGFATLILETKSKEVAVLK